MCVSREEGTWPGKEAGDSPLAPDLPFSGTGAASHSSLAAILMPIS